MTTDKTLIAFPHRAEPAGNTQDPPAQPGKGGRWFHYTNLKVEAAIFLLIALTFAAVLGQGAITNRELAITPSQSAQFYPYSYGDKDNGGKSSVNFDPARPLSWSCVLREGFATPYCGYGLFVGESAASTGLDFSHYQDITIRLTYRGNGNRLKLMLKDNVPAKLRGKVKDDPTIPLFAEFDVVNGKNEIHLTKDQLAAESWWIASHQLTQAETKPQLDHVVAIAFASGSAAPMGTFDVSVQSLTFSGSYLSTAQWYLIILGIWLVLTGAFLVYRFLNLRQGYEARQRQQAEEAETLAAARAAAEAASAAKSQFLANMSHELRTPLNAILGYAQLLKTADLTERQLSGVKTIHQSGEHLLTLITDILDIAKVEAGKMELVMGPADIRSCVFTVAQMIRLRAEEKGLRFTVEIDDDVPRAVIADQKRLRQVLINLLGNAVKFTEAGEVRLEVATTALPAGKAGLRFSVIDSGVGIRADQIERLFRPFEQAGNAIDRSGGTGLGLSISHQIVTMMQGDIRVESTPGEGSRFVVEAPFPLATPLLDYLDEAMRDMPAMPEPPSAYAPETPDALIAPAGEQMERLLAFARAGNLRAVRKEVPAILAAGSQYQAFAERIDTLAAAYQSPALLRLIEQSAEDRSAA